MSERSKTISRLRGDFDARASYIKAKLGVLVPSKIKALRLRSNMPRQRDLAVAAKMHQSRISMFETPGVANLTLETLAKLAAAFKVGLIVEFVPFSEMLRRENQYSQDTFDVTRIDQDAEFVDAVAQVAGISNRFSVAGYVGQTSNVSASVTTVSAGEIAIAPAPPRAVIGQAPQYRAVAAGGRET